MLGNYASPNLSLAQATSNSVIVPAGAGTGQVELSINGKPRWVVADVTAAVPAGGAQTYNVWAVTADDVFVSSGGTDPYEIDNTDHTFGLRVLAAGATPTGAGGERWYRKIGEAVWDGAALTAVYPTLSDRLPRGVVGGDLSGTLPNPRVAAINGRTAADIVFTTDGRLSDQRVPTANSVDNTKVANGALAPAKTAGTAVITTDTRLTDARNPLPNSVGDAAVPAGGLSPNRINGTAIIQSDGRLNDARAPIAGSVVNASVNDGALNPSKITGTAVVETELAAHRLSDDHAGTYVNEGQAAGGDLGGTYPNPLVRTLLNLVGPGASGQLLTDSAFHVGAAYDGANSWMRYYIGVNIRYDGANWQNEPNSGNNGWTLIGFGANPSYFRVFTDAPTGNVTRSYTPAQLAAKMQMASDAPKVRVWRSGTDQQIVDNTYTVIGLDSDASNDPGGMHTAVDRITLPLAGWWELTAAVNWNDVYPGAYGRVGKRAVSLYVDGAVTKEVAAAPLAPGNGPQGMEVSGLFRFAAAGSIVQLGVFHNTGVANYALAGVHQTVMTARWLGAP